MVSEPVIGRNYVADYPINDQGEIETRNYMAHVIHPDARCLHCGLSPQGGTINAVNKHITSVHLNLKGSDFDMPPELILRWNHSIVVRYTTCSRCGILLSECYRSHHCREMECGKDTTIEVRWIVPSLLEGGGRTMEYRHVSWQEYKTVLFGIDYETEVYKFVTGRKLRNMGFIVGNKVVALSHYQKIYFIIDFELKLIYIGETVLSLTDRIEDHSIIKSKTKRFAELIKSKKFVFVCFGYVRNVCSKVKDVICDIEELFRQFFEQLGIFEILNGELWNFFLFFFDERV